MARSTAPLPQRLAALKEAAQQAQGRIDPQVEAQVEAVLAHVDKRLAFSGDTTVVAIAGATGSGKSSLFNAVSKTTLAEPGVRRPTTSAAMAASFGDEQTALLDWLDVPRRHLVTGAPEMDGLMLLDLPDHERLLRLALPEDVRADAQRVADVLGQIQVTIGLHRGLGAD